jgi:hypothetical protein
MNRQTVPPRLGQNILVIMENTPVFLDALRDTVAGLPEIDLKSFMLLYCCPVVYWEHGGGDDPQTQQQVQQVWEARRKEFDLTKQYLKKAAAILQDAGVPASSISTRIATDRNTPAAAVIAEMQQNWYSGVITGTRCPDIVSRLERRGLTDRFRSIPEAEVLVLNTGVPAAPV